MKRAVIVLLLLIANAIVSSSKVNISNQARPEAQLAHASSLHAEEDGKLKGCIPL